MEVFRRPLTYTVVHREDWRVQDRSVRKDSEREMLALRNMVQEETHLEIYGGSRKDSAMKPCARLITLHKKKQNVISCRGPGPTT